jgi:O-antigen ligase
MARFFKPFLFTYIAFICSRTLNLDLKLLPRDLTNISVAIFSILLLSDIFYGNFPAPRLGGLFFNFEVYGFPNSAAVFYTVFFGIFVQAMIRHKSAFFFLISIFAFFIIAFTLSRAAIFTALACIFFISLRYGWRFSAWVGSTGAAIFFVLSLGEFDLSFADSLFVKLEKVSSDDDMFSGREYIWGLALNLISEKPFFGYGFRPFSDFSNYYDTPHNQHLEVVYKIGLLGFISYSVFFAVIIMGIYRMSSYFRQDRKLSGFLWTVLSIFLAFLVAGFSQPTVSYSVLGNFFVFLGSLLCFHFYQLRKI